MCFVQFWMMSARNQVGLRLKSATNRPVAGPDRLGPPRCQCQGQSDINFHPAHLPEPAREPIREAHSQFAEIHLQATRTRLASTLQGPLSVTKFNLQTTRKSTRFFKCCVCYEIKENICQFAPFVYVFAWNNQK